MLCSRSTAPRTTGRAERGEQSNSDMEKRRTSSSMSQTRCHIAVDPVEPRGAIGEVRLWLQEGTGCRVPGLRRTIKPRPTGTADHASARQVASRARHSTSPGRADDPRLTLRPFTRNSEKRARQRPWSWSPSCACPASGRRAASALGPSVPRVRFGVASGRRAVRVSVGGPWSRAQVDRDGAEKGEPSREEHRAQLRGLTLVGLADHLLDDDGGQRPPGEGQHGQGDDLGCIT